MFFVCYSASAVLHFIFVLYRWRRCHLLRLSLSRSRSRSRSRSAAAAMGFARRHAGRKTASQRHSLFEFRAARFAFRLVAWRTWQKILARASQK